MIFVLNVPTTPDPFAGGFISTTHSVDYCACIHCKSWREWTLYRAQIREINTLLQEQKPWALTNPQGF